MLHDVLRDLSRDAPDPLEILDRGAPQGLHGMEAGLDEGFGLHGPDAADMEKFAEDVAPRRLGLDERIQLLRRIAVVRVQLDGRLVARLRLLRAAHAGEHVAPLQERVGVRGVDREERFERRDRPR